MLNRCVLKTFAAKEDVDGNIICTCIQVLLSHVLDSLYTYIQSCDNIIQCAGARNVDGIQLIEDFAMPTSRSEAASSELEDVDSPLGQENNWLLKEYRSQNHMLNVMVKNIYVTQYMHACSE